MNAEDDCGVLSRILTCQFQLHPSDVFELKSAMRFLFLAREYCEGRENSTADSGPWNSDLLLTIQSLCYSCHELVSYSACKVLLDAFVSPKWNRPDLSGDFYLLACQCICENSHSGRPMHIKLNLLSFLRNVIKEAILTNSDSACSESLQVISLLSAHFQFLTALVTSDQNLFFVLELLNLFIEIVSLSKKFPSLGEHSLARQGIPEFLFESPYFGEVRHVHLVRRLLKLILLLITDMEAKVLTGEDKLEMGNIELDSMLGPFKLLMAYVQDLFLAPDCNQEDVQATRRLYLYAVARIVEHAVVPKALTAHRDGLLATLGKAARLYVPEILKLGTTELIPALFDLFQEQDRILVDICNSLLAIYISCTTDSAQFVGLSEDEITALSSIGTLSLYLSPHKIFLSLLHSLGYDHSILIDFLISNETNLLLYFLTYLKLVVREWETFVNETFPLIPLAASRLEVLDQEKQDSAFHLICDCILRTLFAVRRLNEKNLFPYNVAPLLKNMSAIEELYQLVDDELHYDNEDDFEVNVGTREDKVEHIDSDNDSNDIILHLADWHL